MLVEARARTGGQLYEIPDPVENLPGHPPVRGASLAEALHAQCNALGVTTLVDTHATLDPKAPRVTLSNGTMLDVGAVVIATGVRRRRLGIPGERTLANVWTNIGPDRTRFTGARALVVGGGDDAFEHARLLAPHAASVLLVHRSTRFSARPAIRDAVLDDTRVQIRTATVLTRLEGDAQGHVVRAHLQGPEGVCAQDVDAVFVCVGPEPVSEGFGVGTDARGYVRVDRLQRTTRSQVLAVGDVCCPEAPTLATAFGHGAVAAKVIASGATTVPAEHTDRLTVTGLTLPARIGVYPREWKRLQTLTFDITFEVDAAAASPSDSLARTIDYAAVASMTEEMLAEQHYNLIETVADTLARRLLSRFDANAVRVRVTKPGVPQRHAAASIEVERRRGP
jgi:thioredoxin reductase (NADPH)